MAGKLLLLLLPLALARMTPRLERVSATKQQAQQAPTYTEMWFQEDLDHINRDPGSIKIRVLKLNQASPAPQGPLIVYTGNEGPIDAFFNITGFLTITLPAQISCSVYFIEHRYYGKSLPSPFTWGYLNTEQVLYDYADIIQQLRPSNTTPVIVVGGSYGGMLAAWMRIKYTHIVDGAIASSAPVFMGLDNGEGYFTNVTDVLNYYGCGAKVKQAFAALKAFSASSMNWPLLTVMFRSCSAFTSTSAINALNNWLITEFAGVVQLNYPGTSAGDDPQPPWPANATCQYFQNITKSSSELQLIQAMANSQQVYYNYTVNASCFDIVGSSRFTPNSWDYQTCTEMWCPQGTNNVSDVFPPNPWNSNTEVSYCKGAYGVTPRPEMVPINYGMTSLNSQRLKYASNILFMNGQLDPWYYGCVTSTTNPNITVYTMKYGAHHTDLRANSTNDTPDITSARQLEISMIKQWVAAKKVSMEPPTPQFE